MFVDVPEAEIEEVDDADLHVALDVGVVPCGSVGESNLVADRGTEAGGFGRWQAIDAQRSLHVAGSAARRQSIDCIGGHERRYELTLDRTGDRATELVDRLLDRLIVGGENLDRDEWIVYAVDMVGEGTLEDLA